MEPMLGCEAKTTVACALAVLDRDDRRAGLVDDVILCSFLAVLGNDGSAIFERNDGNESDHEICSRPNDEWYHTV